MARDFTVQTLTSKPLLTVSGAVRFGMQVEYIDSDVRKANPLIGTGNETPNCSDTKREKWRKNVKPSLE